MRQHIKTLADVPAGHTSSLSIAPEEHETDRRVRHLKELTLFFIGVTVVLATLAWCFYILFSPGSSLDEKRWYQSVVTLILGGMFAHFLKK